MTLRTYLLLFHLFLDNSTGCPCGSMTGNVCCDLGKKAPFLRNAIRKGLAFELLNAQDAVLCSYFAQRAEARSDRQVQVGNGTETFQGLSNFD
jgi:hypothetical protein